MRELCDASLKPMLMRLEHERLEKEVRDVRIQTEGKTDQQLKEEITKAVN